MPGERNKKKNRGRVRSRRVASSRFSDRERARGVRRGCANPCAGPFLPAEMEEPRERRFPSPRREDFRMVRAAICLETGFSARGPPSSSDPPRTPANRRVRQSNPRFRILFLLLCRGRSKARGEREHQRAKGGDAGQRVRHVGA